MWAVVHIAPNRAEAELTKHMLEAEGILGICSKTPVNRPTLSVTTGGLRPLDSEKTSLDLVT